MAKNSFRVGTWMNDGVQAALKDHCECLSNVVFDWDPNYLTNYPMGDPPPSKNFLRQVRINDMQFGLMPKCGTDAIFIVHQLQKKFHAINETLYLAFVDLEKAFDRAPDMSSGGLFASLALEWLVGLIQSMYENARSRVPVDCNQSDEIGLIVGVPQDPCLSPQLFNMVLQAIS